MRLIIVASSILLSCASASIEQKTYPAHVGNTTFNATLDDPAFRICNELQTFQYYNFGKGMQYKGEKAAINHFFNANFKNTASKASGYVTIRFVVNCEGKTGWFRVQAMDYNYQKIDFDEQLISQLLMLTKQLDGWIIGVHEDKKVDYYQYLTFKLEEGQLIEIMP